MSVEITGDLISQKAQTIRMYNGELTTKLNEIRKIINNLTMDWDTPAGNAVREKYLADDDIVNESYRGIINSYADFLDGVVDLYDQIESKLENNAEAFH